MEVAPNSTTLTEVIGLLLFYNVVCKSPGIGFPYGILPLGGTGIPRELFQTRRIFGPRIIRNRNGKGSGVQFELDSEDCVVLKDNCTLRIGTSQKVDVAIHPFQQV